MIDINILVAKILFKAIRIDTFLKRNMMMKEKMSLTLNLTLLSDYLNVKKVFETLSSQT